MTQRKSKYKQLLENKSVKRWYDNICRGSLLTGDVYLNKVGYFCLLNNTTPQNLAKMTKRKVYTMLLDMVTDFESRKKSGGYIQSILKSVKSWMKFNGKKIDWDIRINGLNKRPTLVNQRTPTQKELGRIFLAGNLKARMYNKWIYSKSSRT